MKCYTTPKLLHPQKENAPFSPLFGRHIIFSQIIENSAQDHGGAIYCSSSNLFIDNTLISNNTAVYYGGGIRSGEDSNLTFENLTIVDNSSSNGEGLFLIETTLHFCG